MGAGSVKEKMEKKGYKLSPKARVTVKERKVHVGPRGKGLYENRKAYYVTQKVRGARKRFWGFLD